MSSLYRYRSSSTARGTATTDYSSTRPTNTPSFTSSRPNRVSARAVSVEPTNRDSMTYTRANFNSSTLTRSYNSSSTGNSNVSPYAAKSERYSSNDSLSNYRPPAPTYRSTGLSSVGRSSSLSGSNFSISSLRDRASSPSRDYERYKPPDRSYRDKEGTPTKSTLSLRERATSPSRDTVMSRSTNERASSPLRDYTRARSSTVERNSSTKALDKYRIENHVSSYRPSYSSASSSRNSSDSTSLPKISTSFRASYDIRPKTENHTPYKSKDMKIDDTELESRFEQLYNKYVRDSDTSDNESVKSFRSERGLERKPTRVERVERVERKIEPDDDLATPTPQRRIVPIPDQNTPSRPITKLTITPGKSATVAASEKSDPSDRAGSTTPTQEFFNKELTEMGTKTRKIYIKSRNSESPIKAVQASQASTEENGKIGKTTMKTFIKRSESPKFDAGKIDGICIKETGGVRISIQKRAPSPQKETTVAKKEATVTLDPIDKEATVTLDLIDKGATVPFSQSGDTSTVNQTQKSKPSDSYSIHKEATVPLEPQYPQTTVSQRDGTLPLNSNTVLSSQTTVSQRNASQTILATKEGTTEATVPLDKTQTTVSQRDATVPLNSKTVLSSQTTVSQRDASQTTVATKEATVPLMSPILTSNHTVPSSQATLTQKEATLSQKSKDTPLGTLGKITLRKREPNKGEEKAQSTNLKEENNKIEMKKATTPPKIVVSSLDEGKKGSTKSSGESKGFSLRKRIGRTLENLKDSILQKKISDTMESSITISDEEDQPSTSADYVSCIKDVNTIDDENDDLYTVATISMNGKQNTRGDSMSPVEWTTIQTLLPQKNEEEEGNQQRCRILIWPQPGHEMCPPMVMVTQPSQPNTPIGKVEFFAEESSGESTEEVESFSDESDDVYESDFEYSASETVSFALPIAIVTNGPAVVNDLSFLEQSHDLRGRVESFLAQPPPLPVFTCSVTYDGQLSGQEPDAWDSADEGDEEEERGPETLMSRLNGPERRSSDEESNYHGQTVGATLTLVQKAALKGEGEEDSDTAEYYESDEYSDETDFDEDEEFTTDSYDSQSDEGSFESEIESASMSFESASEQSDEPSQLQTAIEELPKVFDLEKMLVQSIVKEIDEEIEEAMLEDLPEEENPINPEIREVNEEKGETEVNMEPTYVKQSEEKVKEVTASRYFPEKQPATDFAKKAVIQPPKLEKARVATVETKMADSPKPKLQSTKVERKVQDELQFGSTLSKIMAAGKLSDGPKDKSSVRKSALNMTADEAKRKELENEEAAKKSARRYNLVGSLAEKFKEATEMPQEKITYRRSKALQSKEEERPRRKYAPIIQPVVDDSFDKQMEELREKMKAGTTAFQKEFTDLKKGMLTKAEEAKIKGQEDNHKKLLDQAAKVMGKADEEKRRQKGLRDAEIEKELAKNETRKVKKVKQQKDDAEDEEPKKSEPRRTVRRLKQDDEATTADGSKERKTSTVSPADKLAKPSLPKTQIVETQQKDSNSSMSLMGMLPAVNDDNLSILETAHAVATKKRSALDALRNRRSCGPDMSVAARGPAGDGAAATRIRNMALAVASNPPSARPRDGDLKTTPITVSTSQANNEESSRKARKYGQRRKTEEIILPPKEPTKPKRRRDYSRANRFIRKPGDIDMILGWEKEANKFENFERLFMTSENDRVKPQEAPPKKKSRRNAPTKIWISELTDIDKIYKTAELRDIIASAQG